MEAAELTDDLADLARLAATALHLELGGVDIIEAERGPLILEVNASPGLRGVESATGIDLATDIVVHLEKLERRRHER